MPVAILILLTVALSGCASRAPYSPPDVPPAVLHQASVAAFDTRAFHAAWWRQFDDPVLDALVGEAATANHDIRGALARVAQARAVVRDVARDRYPVVTAGARAERRNQVIPGFTEEPIDLSSYQAGFDATWELDLFGRVRSMATAAATTAEGLELTLDDVRVRVVADVARSYFELRGLQRQLAVAERSLDNQREMLRLTRVRREVGIGEELDVASAAARVAATEASVPPLRALVAEREYRLAVLTGVRPGDLRHDLSPRPYPPLARALAIGEPTDLLRRRPDVRAAERQVATAVARQGVAAADLYPRVTLTGFLGFLAGRGTILGSPDSRAWAVSPGLTWAAFDLGSVRARLRGAEAATDEALVQFEQTVLLALEEAANALVAYAQQQERLVHVMEQARESARAADIARLRYREGLTDFLYLLDAERMQLDAENSLAQAEADTFTRVVAVYKALGGVPGREPDAPPIGSSLEARDAGAMSP